MKAIVDIQAARAAAQIEIVKGLFVEYAQALDIKLCFQGFEQELDGLPGKYAPPEGDLLLALAGEDPAGCVAFRPMAAAVCEMKRLYVRRALRGTGLGRRLAQAAMKASRESGYERMRLDTLASMTSAAALYRSLGFREIEAYYRNPIPGALYFEVQL